ARSVPDRAASPQEPQGGTGHFLSRSTTGGGFALLGRDRSRRTAARERPRWPLPLSVAGTPHIGLGSGLISALNEPLVDARLAPSSGRTALSAARPSVGRTA